MNTNKAVCVLQRLQDETRFNITSFTDDAKTAQLEAEVEALDIAIKTLDPEGTANLAGNTPEEWAEAIAGRISDEVDDYHQEDRALLREVLAEALAPRRDLILKLVGTNVIEEDYFEDLAENAQ